MHLAKALLISCVAACSGADIPPPAPASTEVDPYRDLVEIPDSMCPELSGWLAMTPRAVKLMLDRDIEREASCRSQVEAERTGRRIAESQRDVAIKAAESSGWWAHHGWKIGAGVGSIATAAAAFLIWIALGSHQ